MADLTAHEQPREFSPLAESPSSGVLNGINVTYVFAHLPRMLFLNGIHQLLGTDYTRSGLTVTMTVAPQSTDTIYALY